jgi:hypothetical protein
MFVILFAVSEEKLKTYEVHRKYATKIEFVISWAVLESFYVAIWPMKEPLALWSLVKTMTISESLKKPSSLPHAHALTNMSPAPFG